MRPNQTVGYMMYILKLLKKNSRFCFDLKNVTQDFGIRFINICESLMQKDRERMEEWLGWGEGD